MPSVSLDMHDLLSAILVLAGTRIAGGIPRSAIHHIFWKMQPEEPLLAGIRFSITGDVCFSREIDAAIHTLLARGTVRAEKNHTIVLNDTPAIRSLDRAIRSRANFDKLLTASRNFHRRFEEWGGSLPEARLRSSGG